MRARKTVATQKSRELYVLEKAEADEVRAATEKNRAYKRGVDEAAVGQKADADARLERAKEEAAAKRAEEAVKVEAKFVGAVEAEHARLLAAAAAAASGAGAGPSEPAVAAAAAAETSAAAGEAAAAGAAGTAAAAEEPAAPAAAAVAAEL